MVSLLLCALISLTSMWTKGKSLFKKKKRQKTSRPVPWWGSLAVYAQRNWSERISTSTLFNNRAKHSGRALQVGSFDRFGKLLHANEIGKKSGCKAHAALAILEHTGLFSAWSSAGPWGLPTAWERRGMAQSRSARKPVYLQVATCSLLYLLCISPAVYVLATSALVRQHDLLVSQVLSLHKSGEGGNRNWIAKSGMKMRYQPPQLSSTLSKNLKTGSVSPGNLDTNRRV